MTTFKTADAVFHDAQTEYGKAQAAFLLDPSMANEQEMRSKGRAMTEAAMFAANNLTPPAEKSVKDRIAGSTPAAAPNLTK